MNAGKINAKQVLSNLYGLMMEINLHRDDEDVLKELLDKPDNQLENHLIKVKQLSTRLKIESNKSNYQNAIIQLDLLRKMGAEELKKMIQPFMKESPALIPLFNKFEELTDNDENEILKDQELLFLIKLLNDKINGERDTGPC